MSRKHKRKRKRKKVQYPTAHETVVNTYNTLNKLHGIKGFRGPELVLMVCPQCEEKRMMREKGHVISLLKCMSLDNSKKRYVDVCDTCLRRFAREDNDYKNRRVREAEQALLNKKDINGDASLEDAL